MANRSSKAMELALERCLNGNLIKRSDHEERIDLIEANHVGDVRYREEDNNWLRVSSPKRNNLPIYFGQEPLAATTERSSTETNNSKSTSALQNNQRPEDQLESTKAQMVEVREENEKLKLRLLEIIKDYQSLKMHFHNIVQRQEPRKSADTSPNHREGEEPGLVSLSLGIFPSVPKDGKKVEKSSKCKNEENFGEGLSLGLGKRFDPAGSTQFMKNPSPENSFEDSKEEESTETWPPSKSLKTVRNGDAEDVIQQNPSKKARVSVRAVCDTPTMNDGCQWRKYGQKIAKGNPCPRAYYRCTVSPSCPVRKQVQRCAEDMSILITTYEGTHNHPLPVSATVMASTTSAAASMLHSASTSSRPGIGTSANLHGLNFSLTNNSRFQPFYLPKTTTTISNSQLQPTVILDLTSPPNSSHSHWPSSSSRYSSPCVDFPSSLSTSYPEYSNNLQQTSWRNGHLSYYGTLSDKKNNIGTSYVQKQPHQQPSNQLNNILRNSQSKTNTHDHRLSLMTDTIAAATKAITCNSTIQSAFAAAFTSFVGTLPPENNPIRI